MFDMMKGWAKMFLLLSVPCFFMLSCRKDPKPTGGSGTNYGFVPVPQNLMDYAYFKPGTWWVYQDSVSGKIDSVYVSSSSTGYDTIDANDNLGYTGIFGWFNLRYYNSYGFYYNQYCHTSYGTNTPRVPVYFYKASSQYNSTQGILMTSRFVVGDYIYVSGSNSQQGILRCEGTFDSLWILNNKFINVVTFYNSVQKVEKDNRTITFFAKNIGLIKKQLLDSNQNWQLIKYNIVQ